MCTILELADRYGLGQGVYPAKSTEILNPHANCTSYPTYELIEDVATLSKAPSQQDTLINAAPIEQGKSEAISQLVNNPSMARKLGDGGEDAALNTLLREQGFNGKGNVISKAEIDRYINAGERELFRGVSEAKFADQFRDGDLFAGLGTYGNGTYTAYGSGKLDTGKFGGEGLKVAKDYAGSKGTIVRMTLKSDAKVVGYDDLLGEMMDYEDVLFDKLAKAKTAKERAAIEAEQLLIKDFGRFATMRGYDAIDVRREKYLVVLNRTALRIQKENFDLKGDGGGYNVK